MPIGDAYATAAEYRAVVQKTDTGQDAEIAQDLLAVSRYLERRLGRFFNKDTTAQERIYVAPPAGRALRPDWAETENPWRYGGLSRVLYIDDLAQAPEAVSLDLDRDGVYETALAASDYELLPRNAPLGPEAAPYTAIELAPWGRFGGWPPGVRVKVRGIWGWPAVPAAIKRATIHLTALLRLETPRASRQMTAGLETALETSREAQSIVDELYRHYARLRL